MEGDSGWRGFAWDCAVCGTPLIGGPGISEKVTQGTLFPICSFGIVIWEILIQKKPYSGSGPRWSLRWGPGRGCGRAEGLWGQDKWQVCIGGNHLLFRGSHHTLLPYSPFFLKLTL